MSLLMEALKKAERAKQAAREQEQGDQSAAREKAELQLAPDDPAAPAEAAAEPATEASGPHPLLRDPRQGRLEFPRLELESIDDREFDLDPVKPRAPKDAHADTDVRGRAAARAVFEAKQSDRVPKNRTLLILSAIAVLAALGVGGYFWMQLQGSGSSLAGPQIAAGPVSARLPTPATMVTAAPVAQVAASPARDHAAAAPAASLNPPGANVGATREAAETPHSGRPLAPPRPIARAVSATGASPESGARKIQASGSVRISPPAVKTNPLLDAAYGAYLANDLAAARASYSAVLERDAANRDALLGLAGVAARERRFDEAESLYLQVLRADPTDTYAQTGLISIRSSADPVAAESRLKTLVASQPDAAFLHYALGNLYAKQRRWNDAEQEHFRAFALDGDNADYCYNLAVSLDQIRQPKQALAHYQRALALAAVRPASFDPSRLRARISELQQ